MDFRLSEDQEALRDALRALLAGRFSLERLRQAEGRARVIDAASWQALGEAGVFSLLVAEAYGGLGLGLAEVVVVFEELGRALVPGPLVGTLMAAGLVDGAIEGTAVVGVADWPTDPVPPFVVEHLGALDALLLLPAPGSDNGVVVVDPSSFDALLLDDPLDPLTPVWQVAGGRHRARAGTDADAAAYLAQAGTVATAALQVGHAADCLERAVAYATERHQFDRPIGSFQAVKHLCADMLTRVELARCAVQCAACLVDQPDVADDEAVTLGLEPEAAVERAVAGAKLLADEAALANARAAIQVHGGMGFTWEVPLHLHLKRAHVLATTFGTAGRLAGRVAELLEAGAA